jgi:hypothetical protein
LTALHSGVEPVVEAAIVEAVEIRLGEIPRCSRRGSGSGGDDEARTVVVVAAAAVAATIPTVFRDRCKCEEEVVVVAAVVKVFPVVRRKFWGDRLGSSRNSSSTQRGA